MQRRRAADEGTRGAEMGRGTMPKDTCFLSSSAGTAGYIIFLFGLLFPIVGSRLLHLVLRNFRQTRLISEFIVGMLAGTPAFRPIMDPHATRIMDAIAQFSVAAYMFVTGLEMEPRTILRRPGREAVVAYAGIVGSVVIFVVLYPLFDRGLFAVAEMHSSNIAIMTGFIFANTSSPVLTRLTTELKIGKSDIGRIAVNAGHHNDMVTTMYLCFFAALGRGSWMTVRSQSEGINFDSIPGVQLFRVLFGIAVQAVFLLKVMPLFLDWINERNPEGKRMKGLDVALSAVVIGGVCLAGSVFFFGPRTNAFLVGLLLPREGRLSNHLITKLNLFLAGIGIPFFLCHVGLRINLGVWNGVGTMKGVPVEWTWLISTSKLVVYFVASTIGKVAGTVAAALYYGFRIPEGLALGLLLNVKGLFHFFCIFGAWEKGMANENTTLVLLVAIMCTIVYIPLVVAVIVWRSRERAHVRRMALQWHDPSSELRMVVGLHGPQNVPAVVNIIEATRGRGQSPLTVFAMDLFELTDRAAATMMRGQKGGLDAVTVMDEEIMESRDAVTVALDGYAQEAGDGLTIRRLLVVSSFSSMYQDVCNGAEDIMAVLIILPFHRSQRVDGGMDSGHAGFRQVNQKVLQHAPCSVGILVDRGLAGPNPSSTSYASKKVAVIFIGGKDDREALVYAGRMAAHPSIHLSVVRFLHDSGVAEAPRGHVLHISAGQDRERELDDACFAQFYERHIADGAVGYVEHRVASGAETVATLRSLEGMYNLFIVGRSRRRDSTLTAGMSDWAECPELGPIGDVLAASDFSVTASVLIIQQHSHRGDAEVMDAEFSVM